MSYLDLIILLIYEPVILLRIGSQEKKKVLWLKISFWCLCQCFSASNANQCCTGKILLSNSFIKNMLSVYWWSTPQDLDLLLYIILSKMKIFYAVFSKFLRPFSPRTTFGTHYLRKYCGKSHFISTPRGGCPMPTLAEALRVEWWESMKSPLLRQVWSVQVGLRILRRYGLQPGRVQLDNRLYSKTDKGSHF